jgi:hypothetical protein
VEACSGAGYSARIRLFRRLQQNQEVLGTDESFFGEEAATKLRDLYTEKSGTLDDDDADEDIHLASLALQVWNSAAAATDQKAAAALPPIVSATRAQPDTADAVQDPSGAIAFLRFPNGADALVRVDERGEVVSQSLSGIFRTAACAPETPALPRAANHHDLVARCVQIATDEQPTFGGQLGSLRSVRRKLWELLTRFRSRQQTNPDLFSSQTLEQLETVFDLIWRFPLKRSAQDAISRQMRLGITDEALVPLVLGRAAEENLWEVRDDDPEERGEPRLICSLGLVHPVSMPTSTEDQA